LIQLIFFLIMSSGSAVILYQDFKFRFVHIIPLLLLFFGVIGYNARDFELLRIIVPINILFLLFLLGFLHFYIFLRTSRLDWIFNRYFGLADIIMLLILCFSYSLYNYILFILFSSVVSLCFWVVSNYVFRKRMVRIPFAGVVAILHIAVIVVSGFSSFNPLINLMY